jgi:hypothetical protein
MPRMWRRSRAPSPLRGKRPNDGIKRKTRKTPRSTPKLLWRPLKTNSGRLIRWRPDQLGASLKGTVDEESGEGESVLISDMVFWLIGLDAPIVNLF